MGEELDLNNALKPNEVEDLRRQYKEEYGADAVPAAEQPAEPKPLPQKVITSSDVPRAPFIEPEAERTMSGAQARELRRQFEEQQRGESAPKQG